jgi:ribosomal protein S19
MIDQHKLASSTKVQSDKKTYLQTAYVREIVLPEVVDSLITIYMCEANILSASINVVRSQKYKIH